VGLAVAVLATTGSLFGVVGSGFQAIDDFRGYRAVMEGLGLPTLGTLLLDYLANFGATMPLAKTARNNSRAVVANRDFEALLEKRVEGIDKAGASFMAHLREVRQKAREDERAVRLKRKAVYWSLILLGSLVLLAAALLALTGAA
jgi:hypothetical protein